MQIFILWEIFSIDVQCAGLFVQETWSDLTRATLDIQEEGATVHPVLKIVHFLHCVQIATPFPPQHPSCIIVV